MTQMVSISIGTNLWVCSKDKHLNLGDMPAYDSQERDENVFFLSTLYFISQCNMTFLTSCKA